MTDIICVKFYLKGPGLGGVRPEISQPTSSEPPPPFVTAFHPDF
jgi:hypothetical protein